MSSVPGSWPSLTSFSTLGCPGEGPVAVRRLAERFGVPAVEVLSAADEPVHTGLAPEQVRAARDELGPVEVVALCSYVRLGARADDVVERLAAEAALAARLGARGVRVFPGDDGVGTTEMASRLAQACAELPPGVELWLETHDSHRRGAEVAVVLELVDRPGVGAIWDVAHPWRAGERPADTLRALGPWLRHVQLKDEDHTGAPVAPGLGELPLDEVLQVLSDAGERPTLGLEWELKWHRSAAPLDEALAQSQAWLGRWVPDRPGREGYHDATSEPAPATYGEHP